MAVLPPNAHISTHPCVRAKLSQLRSQSTAAREVKSLIHEIATIVGVEALTTCLQTVSNGTVRSVPIHRSLPLIAETVALSILKTSHTLVRLQR